VWVELKDGNYKRAYCSYNALFSADLTRGRGLKATIDTYPTSQLAANSREQYDADCVFRANSSEHEAADDMTALSHLEEPNMIRCLEVRYDESQIYTNIAGVLVAINPYRDLGIYTKEHMTKYRGQRRLDTVTPHIFAVAERAYQALLEGGNQSMICCGESGSGKTESTKMLMRYLANITTIGGDAAVGDAGSNELKQSLVEKQVVQANPVLEAFGNAKTLMNNNSSRFAKFTKLYLSPTEGRIVGAHTETYLLEKSRVVHPSEGERNFHVFYQLCAGPMRKELQLESAGSFHYLSAGHCIELKGVSDADNFTELRECMSLMGISDEDTTTVFAIVGAVMRLGNINFHDEHKAVMEEKVEAIVAARNRSASAVARIAESDARLDNESMYHVQQIAKLLGCSAEKLESRLTHRRIQIRGKETFDKELSVEQAIANRDAISKALYNALFQWIVQAINKALYTGDESIDSLKWIGILDVFGFESFDYNSFEQFCINFCNERLQHFFNGHILRSEQEEYNREAIHWVPLQLPDNSDVIELITSRPSGLLCLLDSACIMPKGSHETFHTNLFGVFKSHPRLTEAKPPRDLSKHSRSLTSSFTRLNIKFCGFTINHYAGNVDYNAEHFLTKNHGSTHPDTIELFSSSGLPLVRALFEAEFKELQRSQQGNRFVSIGSTFSSQLVTLMKTLKTTTPYFVRCASPNGDQLPNKFVWEYVKPQLVYGGLVEALRMLKFGYPSRVKYDVIAEKYAHALNPMPENLNTRNFCEAILNVFGLSSSQYQLGLTKVFFRPGQQEFLDSIFRRSDDPLTPEMDKKIRQWLVRRRNQRAVWAVRTFVAFRKRQKHIRAAHQFRHAVRLALIYMRTLRAGLYRYRRMGQARKFAVNYIQRWWRDSYRRQKLSQELQKRIRTRRKKRFAMMGNLDPKSAEELNMLRIQMKSAKRKEEAEKQRLEQFRLAAVEKEKKLQEALQERESALERMQLEYEEMKQKETNSEEQERMVAELRARTERLRTENDKARAAAEGVIKERENELRKRERELVRAKELAEKQRLQAEQEQQRLLAQKDQERQQREQELEVLRNQTEELKKQQEAKADEALRLLREREELQAQKQEELRKMHEEAAKLQREHGQVTAELQAKMDAERLAKEQEQAKLQEQVESMRLKIEAEAMTARAKISEQEAEGKRKAEELASMHSEMKRQQDSFEHEKQELEQQRVEERKRAELALKQFEEDSKRAAVDFERQREEASRQLAAQEEENKRKEAILAQMQEDARATAEAHEKAVSDARVKLEKERNDAAAQLEALHAESQQRKLEYEEAAAKRMAETKAQMTAAQDQMRAEHVEQVKQMQVMILERDDMIEQLEDEVSQLNTTRAQEAAAAAAVLAVSQAETSSAHENISELRADMEQMRVAHEEVNAISQRLLAQEKSQREQAAESYEQQLADLRLQLDAKSTELATLQQDHRDVLAHFRQDMERDKRAAHESKRMSMMARSLMPKSESRLFRPNFESILEASILSQKSRRDFILSFPNRSGWLSKQRPTNIIGSKHKIRYFTLVGTVLSWFDLPPNKGGKHLGHADVTDFELIDYPPDESKIDNKEYVLRLVPNKNRRAGSSGSDKILYLQSAPVTKKEQDAIPESIIEWIKDINSRISLESYLHEIYNEDGTRVSPKGCLELVNFVCDAKASEFVIENKVLDVHTALLRLSEALMVRPNSERIVMNNVGLTDPSLKTIADIVSRNHSIEEIEIMHNLITADGAKYLANAIRANPCLRSIRLDNNTIKDDGAIALASAIADHKNMIQLTVSSNKLTDTGATALAQAISNSRFNTLEFSNNMIGDDSCDAIAALLVRNQHILSVELANNVISDEGVSKLAAAYKTGKTGLQELDMSNNQITSTGVVMFSEAIKSTVGEFALDVSDNKLISRTGVQSIIDSSSALEFAHLKVVRR
jgi:myosin heavy subunit